jgi:hypothetical protein
MSSGQRSSNESWKTILDRQGTYTKRAEWQPMQKESTYSISEDVEEMEILKMVLMMM